ncbi:MAG: hypothetical protein QG565_43 [Campylobacterota bacterium]|nr:hypothetical protein [Campylobacterota bacterium]
MKFLVLIFTFLSFVQADQIIEGYHKASRNVIFQENPYKDEVAIIACIDGPIVPATGCYEVDSNDHVFSGYKFTYVGVFVVKRELLDGYDLAVGYKNVAVSEISDKLLEKAKEVDAPTFPFSTSIDISDDYTVIGEKYYYKLERDTDGNYKMVLQKRELEFTDREKVTDYSLINGTQVK